ncbi:MAG TPA: nucleotide sugar dehydrogenase [Dissulfurispiraceae bacterium]|nr:nucleotide sugar dehydrogenase [Dissulfurispiraceae bacterium]
MLQEYREGKKCIAVVGLGYVGLPLCVSLGRVFPKVTGFDINADRIRELQARLDKNKEVASDELMQTSAVFTADPSGLVTADIIIVAVPTPINSHKIPDLTPIRLSSEIVGSNMKPGVIVVYESTVYPGVTEEVCGPILETASGLKCGVEFKLGYSPERMNPGDKVHTVENIVKVVAGQDVETADLLCAIYGSVVKAGIHHASNIKTAEAAKVIENIQRDLNIALMNELAIIFKKLGIDTREVLAAARTKWNFIPFEPGLVGGHCIGVDPYYLTFKAEELGYRPEVILSGRRINDNMGKYIAEQTIKELIKAEVCFKGNRILILGFTFKENINDIRNTRVIDIYHELRQYGVQCFIFDPFADAGDVHEEYGLQMLESLDAQAPYDGVIAAVKHDAFQTLELARLQSVCRAEPVFMDVKSCFPREAIVAHGFRYWSL